MSVMASQITDRLFVQQLVQANNQENIEYYLTFLWGESTGDWRIPLIKVLILQTAFPCNDVIIFSKFTLWPVF